MAQVLIDPNSTIPLVGASGAIGGVLGGYLVLFPTVRVRGIIPLGFFSRMAEWPAWMVLGLWFVLQLINGSLSLFSVEGVQEGGVAFFAHIGGFIFGMVFTWIFMRLVPQPPSAPDKKCYTIAPDGSGRTTVFQKRLNRITRLSVVAGIMIAMLGLLTVRPVGACLCWATTSPDENFDSADAVFQGKVMAVYGGNEWLLRLMNTVGAGGSMGAPEHLVKFEVTNSWKSVNETEVTVRYLISSGACGLDLDIGSEHLVYAYDIDGHLRTGYCNQKEIVSAVSAAEDFAYLSTQPTLALTPADRTSSLVLGGVGVILLGAVGSGAVLYTRRKRNAPT